MLGYNETGCEMTNSFHSFHGLVNSINWPGPSVWVSIAQLVEHCTANEAMGSNPVEVPKTFFGLIRIYLNCDSTAMDTYSFQSFIV